MTTIDNIPKYNKFSKETTELFTQMSEYLDTSLIFYGSILRHDYVKNKSDIDIAVFADNEYSMITKLSHFLRTHKKNFKKVLANYRWYTLAEQIKMPRLLGKYNLDLSKYFLLLVSL